MSPIKSVVFAHGIWADGSCFSKLMPPLRADGYEVIASQHALDDFQADVDCCVRTFARVPSPILLVGHSYGGAVITAAGNDDRVAGLVYISALGPMRMKPCRESRTSSLRRTSLSPSRSPTGVSGCSLKASSTSPET